MLVKNKMFIDAIKCVNGSICFAIDAAFGVALEERYFEYKPVFEEVSWCGRK
jgi:hypothetical protein